MSEEEKFARWTAGRITKAIVKGIMFAIFAVVFVAVFGYVVMRLWNWLTPPLFGWHAIDYWQAWGILVLCRILFGGFRGGPHRQHDRRWRRKMFERWERMTPEEREKLRAGMRGGCGLGDVPTEKTTV